MTGDKKRLNLRIYNHTLANQGSRAKREVLIIIDSNSVIHRAYHALPPLTTKKGELVNAVYGFLLVFLKAIREFQPDFIAACFDFPAPTFRHKKFKEYKAKRPPASEELYRQIPKVKEILKAFNVPTFEKEGFEADDLIGTISQKFPQKQVIPRAEIIILSGDQDTLQLINKNTKVYSLRKGVKDTVLYDEKIIKEKYGFSPEQLIDFKALRGDPSDNIPGAPGIGEKGAGWLIKKFGKIETLYKELEKGNTVLRGLKPRLKEILLSAKDQVFFSKDLAKIRIDVPIDFNLEKCDWKNYDKEKVVQFLKKHEFHSLINRLPLSKAKATNRKERLSDFNKSKENDKIKEEKVEYQRKLF